MDDRRVRFAEWRRDRPFWGGTTLTFAGLVIAVVPLELAARFRMVTNYFVLVGLLFAIPVVLSGVLALVRPQYAEYCGAVGIVFAIASIFGALGGFGVGTVLGMLGGSLCIAWVHPDATVDRSTKSESTLGRIRSRCRGVVDALS